MSTRGDQNTFNEYDNLATAKVVITAISIPDSFNHTTRVEKIITSGIPLTIPKINISNNR
ncbi:hypothetical protein APHACPA_1043 [Rickettsia amblyommatis str. Ac/Pa]|uniref:Uncharacterized protein n=1 Tax=Rickettsia amblyommatis str. Ac/Pa TaxID=1359164 RepID=A0A0F3N1Z3_RICAM|nr:hypothetical protein APHACPA_1043 [Rickettsia amblyommatis str. Ac/Pa]